MQATSYNGPGSVFVYPAGSNGNAAPIASISGSNTSLSSPESVALDSSGNIYVADDGLSGNGPGSVFVYPALGSSTGLLNEAPTATISGSNTVLNTPEGIVLDSSRNIYVADDGPSYNGPGSVFVFPAGSNGNAAPIATISGSNTGLSSPFGVALDSSGNIYVADDGPSYDGPGSVFVYPALGSSTGLLNESAIAAITGSNTVLSTPLGVALDSIGNIYVANDGLYENGPGSVFVYPALGSSTGVLNETPSATISGPKTGLYLPMYIAIQPGAGTPTPAPSTTATAMPTATSAPTASASSAPTASVTPTGTGTGTQTPTAVPTATATPTGGGSLQLEVSQHLGFDQADVGTAGLGDTTNQMGIWWDSSPYFDVGFYPNLAASHPPDPNLNAAWVTAVSGEGWGLMPIWAGEQAPCTCYKNTGNGKYGGENGCEVYPNTFSWDPDVAGIEGALESGLAVASIGINGLGLSGTVAYYDMEQYNSKAICDSVYYPDQSCSNATTCGAAVTAFLNGWVNGLHPGFQAGVYGSPKDAQSDWVDVSPLPDDVWLSYIPNGAYDTVTVWNIASPPSGPTHGSRYKVSDSLWSNRQRIVQYTTDPPCCDETWGGVEINDIDKDIEDGQVIVGNGVRIKNYNFTQAAAFGSPGELWQTGGISGISDVDFYDRSPTNDLGENEMGEVVGSYLDSGGSHGFIYNPNDGVFQPVNCIGFTGTQLWGINNAGVAVGNATDANNNTWVITSNLGPPGPTGPTGPSGVCSQYRNCPNGDCNCPNDDCVGYAINDAGWIAGTWGSVGYVWKNQQDPPLLVPQSNLGIANSITGINGQGIISGWYDLDDVNYYSFIADASQSSITLTVPQFACPAVSGLSSTTSWAGGINDNGEVVGYSYTSNGYTGFLYSYLLNGSVCPLPSVSVNNWLWGINDVAQIVGQPLGSSASGFVLSPQN